MRGKCLLVFVLACLATGGTLQSVCGTDASDDVLKQLQGTWQFVSQEVDGTPRPKDELSKQTISFSGDKWTVHRGGKVIQAGPLVCW